jgi:hypothetical protein
VFDQLWRGRELPEPSSLAALADADFVSPLRLIGVSVPRYWRCNVQRFEVRHGDETHAHHLISGCMQVGPRLQCTVTLTRELPPELAATIEPIVPALLYDVDESPRDADRRAITFIEVRCDDPGTVIVFEERVGVSALPPLDPDPTPRRIEHASMAEALAVHGLELRRVTMLDRRDPSMPLIDILEHELQMRGIPLRYLETREDGLAFAGVQSEFTGVNSFIALRDILRWHAGGF